MPKYEVSFPTGEGEEGGEINFGGQKGDKFKIKGPENELRDLKPDSDGVLRVDSLGKEQPEKPAAKSEPKTTDDQATNLGDVGGLAIGKNAQGENVIDKPGSYIINSARGLAIGSGATVAGESHSTGSSNKPAPSSPRDNPMPPAQARTPDTSNRQVEEGLGSRIIGKYPDMDAFKNLAKTVGFEVNDQGRLAYAREVDKLAKLASRDLELFQKLIKAIS